MNKTILFENGIFHSGKTETDTFSFMTVSDGRITGTYTERPEGTFRTVVDLQGKHVYPCLIDGHVHGLMSIAVMAMGFSICEITEHGVEPDSLAGIEERLRAYAAPLKKHEIIACNNYITSAVREHRLPTKEELDAWGGGRPVVIYNIDGHSTALSTEMLKLVGLDPKQSDGVLTGEENDRIQGHIIDVVGSKMTPALLAKGAAVFQNTCASYGISVVGALEGNGDSPKDMTTQIAVQLMRHFDTGVRLYLQYTDPERAKQFAKYMKRPRIGGCGDWEMDGSVGSHSAAFSVPFRDTGKQADCYYTQEQADELVKRADAEGFQIASHAIGGAAIDRLLSAYEKIDTKTFHRIEHCEFPSDKTFEKLKCGRWAVMMQPGYAWIDKRYLHTYEKYLPEEILSSMKFRSFYDAGICVAGSSDSPVQDMDPYLQMLGMTQFYREEESVTPYEAFVCYTQHAARAIGEAEARGTLEAGKAADFFTASQDFFRLKPEEVVSFRPDETYYSGVKYRKKTGKVAELAKSFLKKPQKI